MLSLAGLALIRHAMSPSDNPFGNLGTPGEGVKRRAAQMRRSARRQRWALLGGGAASFAASVMSLLAFGGVVGLAQGMVAAGSGAVVGTIFLFIGALRIGAFEGADHRETNLRFVVMLVAGALLGAMIGLLVHIGARFNEQALLIVAIVVVAGLIGAGTGYSWANRAEQPPPEA
ncbi:hypothetical protein AYO44_02210 [Planctomycetaceae bacterium SCGC AG-212-F19]|nr:hypothetical protein AYO44_02210 [Planctomycetaceae bacterium SCGC AG-212-F19]